MNLQLGLTYCYVPVAFLHLCLSDLTTPVKSDLRSTGIIRFKMKKWIARFGLGPAYLHSYFINWIWIWIYWIVIVLINNDISFWLFSCTNNFSRNTSNFLYMDKWTFELNNVNSTQKPQYVKTALRKMRNTQNALFSKSAHSRNLQLLQRLLQLS